jgi:hypothetical protein
VLDSDNDGIFDVIQLQSSNPEFEISEVRWVNGQWVMKTVSEWGGPYGAAANK